jgi:hypothetical protein
MHLNFFCFIIITIVKVTKMIPFAMGTHQSDPLGRVLFTLAHFRALHFMDNCFIFYLFPSIVDDTHIISSFSIVSFAYEHF